MLFHFFLRQSSPLIDRLHRRKSQFVTPLLLRQPFDQSLANDPTLAAVNPIGNFVHSCDEIVGKLCGDYTSVISHFLCANSLLEQNKNYICAGMAEASAAPRELDGHRPSP
jgi:hypothetical protein